MKNFCLILLLMVAVFPVWANDKVGLSLQEYAWEKRQLIIFSPSQRDTQYQLFLKMEDEFREEFDDRKLHVWHVIEGRDIKLNKQTHRELNTNDFQQAFGVNSREFRVVLIGYDQQEKLRQNKVRIDYLFAEIDQMPMRIQEMQENLN